MCDISEKWFREGEEAGLKAGREAGLKAGREAGLKAGRETGRKDGSVSQAKKTVYNMAKAGLSIESIASFVDFSIETVTRWLSEQPVPENGK